MDNQPVTPEAAGWEKASPRPWGYRNVSGAGLQLYAPVPRTNAIEYTIKNGDFPVYRFTDRPQHHECYEHMIAYEAFVQFAPAEWDALQEANAALIVEAVNSYEANQAEIQRLRVECERLRPVVDAVLYAMKEGCFFPVPEPKTDASTQDLIQWGAMRNLHDKVAQLTSKE